MTKLRELVTRYISGEIALQEFRRAFVMEFLSTKSPDQETWNAVLAIESEGDDFSEGLLAEDQLKLNIAAILQPRGTVVVFEQRAVMAVGGNVPPEQPSPMTGTSSIFLPQAGMAASLVGIGHASVYA